MKAPENDWDELTPERKAEIDARDLRYWSLKQLRAEIGRRTPFQAKAPVRYWLDRLTVREIELREQREWEHVPKQLRNGDPWIRG